MGSLDWIVEGLRKPGKSRSGLANALGRQPSMVTDLLKGKRELKASEIPIVAEYLGIIPPAVGDAVDIIGRITDRDGGAVVFADKSQKYGQVPMPPGGSKDTVALDVDGDGIRGIAENGSIIYYDELRERPGAEMIGELCLVGLKDGRVLIKFLHEGRGRGLYDLESASSPTLRDQPVEWAALVTAIIPRAQARKIARREKPDPLTEAPKGKPTKR